MSYSIDIEGDVEAGTPLTGNAAIPSESIRRFSLTLNVDGEPVFRIADAESVDVYGPGFAAFEAMVASANASNTKDARIEELERALYVVMCGVSDDPDDYGVTLDHSTGTAWVSAFTPEDGEPA